MVFIFNLICRLRTYLSYQNVRGQNVETAQQNLGGQKSRGWSIWGGTPTVPTYPRSHSLSIVRLEFEPRGKCGLFPVIGTVYAEDQGGRLTTVTAQ